jgi:hypothetical protein
MSGGISGDVVDKLATWICNMFLAGGPAIDAQYGPTAGTAGYKYPILRDVNRIVPAFTVWNSGSNSIKVGPAGTPMHTLTAGVAMTYRWKNPARMNLVFDDLGNSATVDIF